MNKEDPKHSSCDAPEDEASNDVSLVPSDFIVGTIKWVNLPNYPPWPAIIDDNPDTKTSIWIDDNETVQDTPISKVHVVFFDNFMGMFTRAWIDQSNLLPFEGDESMMPFRKLNIGNDIKECLSRALNCAKKAQKLRLKERRRQFCLFYKTVIRRMSY